MNINWKVRVKNPVFWAELAAAIMLPILTHMGLNWADMTTWAALGETLLSAVSNPVIVAAIAVAVWNACTDPTTAGLGDSQRALSYRQPYTENMELDDDKVGGSD